ncbi:MAG: hypothetical protein RR775_13475 [Massilia sp.]|uniref:hypothetical protein n=1 Tax=Massilia sp. TaxID=1882437 RepID=UPI002FCC2800
MLHFSPADLPCWTEQPGSADLLREQMLDPTIELFDAVRITELRQPVNSDLGKGDIRKPEVGDVAWVIEIYEKPPGYELECSDKNGITEWLHLFSPDEIKFEKVVKL